IHLIENPTKATPETVDCISCHTSSRLIRTRGIPFAGAPEEYVNPAGLTGFAELALQQEAPESIRNFGWRFTTPVVTTLTANSSAAVADRANASQHWKNPSRLDCAAPAVRECFAGRAKSGGTTSGSASECLRLCSPRDLRE